MRPPWSTSWGTWPSYYAPTEAAILQAILKSDFVHVDETKINIQGVDHYVWVFTDGKHVVFRMTETREADIVREVLAGYQGVLVSDFYPGYDSMPCRQQKCLVHLIRDINDDLWKAPFDKELEAFAVEVQALLVPILVAVDRFGLKAWHLRKFLKDVERFYDKHIIGREYTSEAAETYQKRFDRYRESLFTFLTQDGIPWENNMAERAIRQLAVQRKISGSFFKRSARSTCCCWPSRRRAASRASRSSSSCCRRKPTWTRSGGRGQFDTHTPSKDRGREEGPSLNSASLTPEPLASSVYVHALEAPSPLKRSISVTSLFPSPEMSRGSPHSLFPSSTQDFLDQRV